MILVKAPDAVKKLSAPPPQSITLLDLLLYDRGQVEAEGRIVATVNVASIEDCQGRDL